MSPQPLNIETLKSDQALVTIADTGSLEAVVIDKLRFDPIYQRDLSADFVQELAAEFDPKVSGTIVVNRRKNKDLFVVDGQHRTAAAKTAGHRRILALVYEDLTPSQEAAMRVQGNNRKNENPLERFRARLIAGDKIARGIDELCKGFDTKINIVPTQEKGINAVGTVEKLYRMDGGVTLARVFEIIQRAWGTVGGEYTRHAILTGLYWLLDKHRDRLDTSHLVDRLQSEGSDGLMRLAYSHQAAHRGSLWVNWYRAVVEVYNRKLPESKRLIWRLSRKRVFGEGE